MASMFDLARRNRRNSWVLIFIFLVLLTALGLSIGSAVGGGTWEGGVVGAAAAAVLAFFMVLFGFLGGDRAILRMSDARQIEHKDNPRLFNVVEEMSIAAGLPMPKVYVIDDSAPNAFATGRDPRHASVAITTGLLDKLNRDEVQGVMAHEMSHIRNYDIRFAMLMAILVGTVVLLADIGLRSLFWGGRGRRRSSGRDGGGIVMLVILLVAILLAIIAPVLAQLIQLASSRQREFLADASAARMTRYPEGLARALEALGADTEPMPQASRATAHMFIVQPMMASGRRRTRSSLWSSHPLIEDRVARLRSIGNMQA